MNATDPCDVLLIRSCNERCSLQNTLESLSIFQGLALFCFWDAFRKVPSRRRRDFWNLLCGWKDRDVLLEFTDWPGKLVQVRVSIVKQPMRSELKTTKYTKAYLALFDSKTETILRISLSETVK